MHALEERVALIEGAIAASQHQQPEARSTAHLESSPSSSQHRSSVVSTEHPAADRAVMVVELPRGRHYHEDPLQASISAEEKKSK